MKHTLNAIHYDNNYHYLVGFDCLLYIMKKKAVIVVVERIRKKNVDTFQTNLYFLEVDQMETKTYLDVMLQNLNIKII